MQPPDSASTQLVPEVLSRSDHLLQVAFISSFTCAYIAQFFHQVIKSLAVSPLLRHIWVGVPDNIDFLSLVLRTQLT